MKVLILGFDNIQEIDDVMEKLIAETQCYLFNVVCGDRNNVAAKWAEKNGAPIMFFHPEKPNDLLRVADYLVMKLTDGSPQWMKNLVMAFKAEGKHGTIVKNN